MIEYKVEERIVYSDKDQRTIEISVTTIDGQFKKYSFTQVYALHPDDQLKGMKEEAIKFILSTLKHD